MTQDIAKIRKGLSQTQMAMLARLAMGHTISVFAPVASYDWMDGDTTVVPHGGTVRSLLNKSLAAMSLAARLQGASSWQGTIKITALGRAVAGEDGE